MVTKVKGPLVEVEIGGTTTNVSDYLNLGVVTSKATLAALSIPAGLFATTVRYHSTRNFGGATYEIKTAAQIAADGDVVDVGGVMVFEIANGNYAVLDKSKGVNVWQLGCGAGFDDAAILNSLFPYLAAKNIHTVDCSDAVLRLDTQLYIKSGVVLKGNYNACSKVKIGSRIDVYYGANPVDPQDEASIVLDIYSGLEGFFIDHPDQVANTSGSPVPYSWTISTSKVATGQTYNTDGIVCSNIFFNCPYRALDLTNAAQYDVHTIYGNPLNEGIVVDQMYDVSTLKRVHFWPFYTATGTALYDYVQANLTAFKFGKVDVLEIDSLFTYGSNIGYHLLDMGSGTPWLDMSKITSDIVNIPLLVEDFNIVNITQATLTTTTRGNFAVNVTNTQQCRILNISQSNLYGSVIAYGAYINCSNVGEINFTDCYTHGIASNDYRIGIIESATNVAKVNTASVGSFAKTYLSGGSKFDGTLIPSLSTETCLSSTENAKITFNDWSAGSPVGWANDVANVTQITDGARWTASTLGTRTIAFNLPYLHYRAVGIRFKLNCSNTLNTKLSIQFRRDIGTNIQEIYSTFEDGLVNDCYFEIPFLMNQSQTATYQLMFIFETYSSAVLPVTLDITDVEFLQLDHETVSQDWLTIQSKSSGYDSLFDVRGGLATMYSDSTPSNGYANIGDKVIRYPAVVGQHKSWVCTVAGRSGTWVSEGVL